MVIVVTADASIESALDRAVVVTCVANGPSVASTESALDRAVVVTYVANGSSGVCIESSSLLCELTGDSSADCVSLGAAFSGLLELLDESSSFEVFDFKLPGKDLSSCFSQPSAIASAIPGSDLTVPIETVAPTCKAIVAPFMMLFVILRRSDMLWEATEPSSRDLDSEFERADSEVGLTAPSLLVAAAGVDCLGLVGTCIAPAIMVSP